MRFWTRRENYQLLSKRFPPCGKATLLKLLSSGLRPMCRFSCSDHCRVSWQIAGFVRNSA